MPLCPDSPLKGVCPHGNNSDTGASGTHTPASTPTNVHRNSDLGVYRHAQRTTSVQRCVSERLRCTG